MDLSAIEISSAGMQVQRRRMDVIAANLANQDSRLPSDEASPMPSYRRRVATIVAGPGGLPQLRVTEDGSGVNPLAEMVDLIAASRAYEANLSAAEVAKSMHQGALRLLG
ncbi:MAG: hypothetical protein JO332_13070 [Planctomycetaceae bacterium]|nr:hypothetical protein [Planctomycetaceae bacterium]